jgi:hypothetical protein
MLFNQFVFPLRLKQFPNHVSLSAGGSRLWPSKVDLAFRSLANWRFGSIHNFDRFTFLQQLKQLSTAVSLIAENFRI